MLRKRPTTANNENATTDNDATSNSSVINPIDETEQEKIIESLRIECAKHISSSWQFLITVCYIASFFSAFAVPFFWMMFWIEDNDSSSFQESLLPLGDLCIIILHSAYAIIQHLMVAKISRKEPNNSTGSPIALLLGFFAAALLPLLVVILFEFVTTTSTCVYVMLALSIGNIITTIAAMVFHFDARNTLHLLKDLESSRYSFKSL
mmetsp:Transcript_18937/g.28248  ORF Transcript_18937/g.28248 Transcript_18937/m.28248 type:complete len:207 (-) Transcript_18937:944-1564(-)